MTLEEELEKIIKRLQELYAENYDIKEEFQISEIKRTIDRLKRIL